MLLAGSFIASDLEAQITLQLDPSNYNGYNISCFGSSNGSINLTITGGIPPYSMVWSNGATNEDLSNLPAGYYRVTVDDSDALTEPESAEITLKEPRKLSLSVSTPKYPNGFNISLYQACNGIVNLAASDGVGPYSWSWNDGSLNQNRTSLCAATYAVEVTDVNGCHDKNTSIILTEPARKDWQLGGNSGASSGSNFIGTIDNEDLVIKTNGAERIRIKNSGQTEILGALKVDTFSVDSSRMVYVDRNGVLKTAGPGATIPVQTFYWQTNGNLNINDQNNYIGTKNVADLVFKTTATVFSPPEERMRITKGGAVSIGMAPTQMGYNLVVEGKAGFREIYVKLNGLWPDYVFNAEYKLRPLPFVEDYFQEHNHLENMPAAHEVSQNGQNLGEIQIAQQVKIEELFLYVIQLNKSIELLKAENEELRNMIEKFKRKK